MFDLGWTELLLIGTVALIVVGPKDLPGMFRTVGKFVGKAKGMAREFSKAMNDAADESGVRDVSDSLRKATNPVGSAMDEVRKSAASFTQATRDAGKPKPKTGDKAGDKAADKPAESTLSPERQADIEKIRKTSHDNTVARLAAEKAAAAEAAEAHPDVTAQGAPKARSKATPQKPAAPKTAARKPAAPKTTAAKTTAAKTTPPKAAAPKRTAKPRATKAASAKQSPTPESKA